MAPRYFRSHTLWLGGFARRCIVVTLVVALFLLCSCNALFYFLSFLLLFLCVGNYDWLNRFGKECAASKFPHSFFFCLFQIEFNSFHGNRLHARLTISDTISILLETNETQFISHICMWRKGVVRRSVSLYVYVRNTFDEVHKLDEKRASWNWIWIGLSCHKLYCICTFDGVRLMTFGLLVLILMRKNLSCSAEKDEF